MTKRPADVPPWISLDRASAVPLHRQLYEGLRKAVLEGRLGAGERLPSTRALARELGVARATVFEAFEQLLAEGYAEGRVGSGTYVAGPLPDHALRAWSPGAAERAPEHPRRGGSLSRRGELMASNAVGAFPCETEPKPFQLGPALDEFPFGLWSRLVARRHRRPPRELLVYGPPAGYWPLRRAIAEHLRTSRAVRCGPEQVIVTSGSQQAIDLVSRALLDPGDEVWAEEPGYPGTRRGLAAAGARVVPVPVDGEGLDVGAGKGLAPGARMACVTPSHHYPLGVTLSLGRRLSLLQWAGEADAWVFEDDYDSEYRYAGRPLAALQGLDVEGRVLYAGTFSKVLFPSLRLGYLVAPPDLAERLSAARTLLDRHPPSLEQAVLADFMAEGHFGRHLRRMRKLYKERQDALVWAAREELAGLLEVAPGGAGMHLVGWLPEGTDGRAASERAASRGVLAPALAGYNPRASVRDGLLLGFGTVPGEAMREGARRLATALRDPDAGSRRVPGRLRAATPRTASRS